MKYKIQDVKSAKELDGAKAAATSYKQPCSGLRPAHKNLSKLPKRSQRAISA